jgi:hypothetical protein
MVFADSNIHEPKPVDLLVVAPPTAHRQPWEVLQLPAGAANLTIAILVRCSTARREPDSARRTEHRNQMFIALHRKALESPLRNMTAATVMLMISAKMTRQQPLHDLTQARWVRRFGNQVKVIGH